METDREVGCGASETSGNHLSNISFAMKDYLKRIYALLLPEERKTGGKVAGAVFLTALLDFVGLASLLPVLYYLLEGGENRQAAMWFCLLAVSVILFKSAVVVGFTRFQNRYLLSLYKRLSFALFSSNSFNDFKIYLLSLILDSI